MATHQLAASYARRSKAWKKGLENKDSVEQQEYDHRQYAKEEGWDLPEHRFFRDNDISARKDTVRKDWIRLNKEVDNQSFDILMLWESSRGDREVGDWINFLEKCQKNKVLIHVFTDERTYNLDNTSDWEVLATQGIRNQVEVRNTKKRTARHMQARARQGLPHSWAPYGYEIYAISPKKNGRRPVYPEAGIVQEIIKRVAESDPLTAIVNDLERREVDCPSVSEAKRNGQELPPTIKRHGTEVARSFKWSTRMVRKICLNVAYIGKRQFTTRTKDGNEVEETVDAEWEAIIDEETFWSANKLLSDPSRKTTKPGKAKHLLTYIAQCDECGTYMGRKKRREYERYQCNANGCTTIRMDWVDLFISELVCARIARPDVFKHLITHDNTKLHTELERLITEHREALDLRARGKLSLLALSQEEERILPRIKELERVLEPPTIPKALEDLRHDAIGNVGLIRSRWHSESFGVAAQKDVIRTLIESIRIVKATSSGKPKDVEDVLRARVKVRWVGQAE